MRRKIVIHFAQVNDKDCNCYKLHYYLRFRTKTAQAAYVN